MFVTDLPRLPVVVCIGPHQLAMYPKRFKSGRVGWYLSQKLEIDGLRVQVSLCATAIGQYLGSTPSSNGDAGPDLVTQEKPQDGPKSTRKGRKGKSPKKPPDAV